MIKCNKGYDGLLADVLTEPTLKSKACLKCLHFTKIISDLCRYLECKSPLARMAVPI